MQMMNSAGQSSIDMSLAATRNTQMMALANQGARSAAWNALQLRSNYNYMSEIRFFQDFRLMC
jgi:hypothetical protein